jgi:hypothetical protein
MGIPSIQLTSAVIALRKVENQPRAFEARKAEIIARFEDNHQAMTRKQISDALWAKYIGRFHASTKK